MRKVRETTTLVVTLACNLSLMACFADINVSQGSVATYARCDGILNIHLTANLLRNLPVKKKFANRLRFDRIIFMSLWGRVFGPPCTYPCLNSAPAHPNKSLKWGTAGAIALQIRLITASFVA